MANGGVAGDGGFRKGDIVRLKRGFDRTLEAIGAHRAGLPLKEGALFEILDCEPGEMSIVLILREVYVVHIAGARHIIKVGSEPFPYVSERFEPV